MVSVRYDETQLSWQVQWRCCGKKSIRVRDSACNSDKTMSGRVARELQGRIEGASDQSAKNAFLKLLEQVIEDALATISACHTWRWRSTSDVEHGARRGRARRRWEAASARRAAGSRLFNYN